MNSYLTAEPQEMEVELKTLESTNVFTSCDSRSSNQMANATTANFT